MVNPWHFAAQELVWRGLLPRYTSPGLLVARALEEGFAHVCPRCGGVCPSTDRWRQTQLDCSACLPPLSAFPTDPLDPVYDVLG